MRQNMLNYEIYLDQIKEMINRVERTTNGVSKEEFVKDINLFDSTILRLQVIGESIKNIPYEFKKKNKQVKWKSFLKLRNFISHKYIHIDPNLIYGFIQDKIPELKMQIGSIK